MKGKKIIACLLAFSMLIQFPDVPFNIGIQAGVEAAEVTQIEEKEIINPVQNEGETNHTSSIEETNQASDEEKTSSAQNEEEADPEMPVQEQQEYPFSLGGDDLPYTTNAENVKTVKINDYAGLIKLSHCDPKEIQNVEIDIVISGSVTLTGASVVKDNVTYSFIGIGSSIFPFAGKFTGQKITFRTDQPLFQAVMSTVDFNGNSIQWESTIGKNCELQGLAQKPMLAEQYWFADTESPVLSGITISANQEKGVVMGALIGEICGENGTLTIGNEINYNGATVEVYSSVGEQNAGLICNTLSNGKVVLTDQFSIPSSYSVTSLGGHAGGIIGEMKQDTALELNASVNKPTIIGKKDVGGVVGHAVNASITGSGSVNSAVVTAQDNSAGGIAGHLEYDAQATENKPELNGLKVVKPSLAAPEALGGLYGTLKLDAAIQAKLTLSEGLSVRKYKDSDKYGASINYGGLIGCLAGAGDTNGDAAILKIDGRNQTITSDGGSNNSYQGGLIGSIGSIRETNAPATVFINNIDIQEAHPTGLEAFGGLAGKIEESSITALSGTISVGTDNQIVCGGGLVGIMCPGSVLSLSGTTDLSGTSFQESENVGQIVGMQDSSLIFANGSGSDNVWNYIRNSQKAKIDDIGNYGQVIRLKKAIDDTSGSKLSSDLFQVQSPDSESGAGKLVMKDYAGTGYTITNEDDFALLAVLWQTKGRIKAGRTPDYAGLSTANISISENDINLTGSGVTGLTRDVKENDSIFHGSFDGNGHSITLAIGETYGCFSNGTESIVPATENDNGCGRIYRHNALGLFASADGSISDLTIEGSIDVESYIDQCYVGGIAGLIEGGTFTLSGVNASEVILCGNASSKAVYAGGLYGAVSKTSNITFGNTADDKAVTSSAVIKVKAVHDGKYMCLGGLIGAIVEENAKSPANQSVITMKNVCLQSPGQKGITINLDGTSITEGQSFFAGGLIGAIVPYASGKTKKVDIEQVTINGYSMESCNTSTGNSISGGLLGSLWAATDVTFGTSGSTSDTYALSVVEGENIANNVTYFGGLVYAASGKWTVHDHGIDLSGATFSAVNANSFGVLVHDAYNGYAYILGLSPAPARGGLYIELTAHWDSAYRLVASPEKQIKTTVKDGASFDEFAAYTAESSIWLSEKNGVISLHTKDSDNDGKLIMDGMNINSYVNRSSVGKTKKTNSHSRYYYNLDKLFTEVQSQKGVVGSIDTVPELMLWSVCRYAATNLQNYFTVGDVKYGASLIGGSNAENCAEFDLTGYSYYPIDLLNMELTVQYADFTFYNQQIENGENTKDNKNTSEKTQHLGMHCGLFRNFLRQSSSTTTIRPYQLAAKNLSFSGTIGKVDNKCGALLCGKVEGNDTNGSNIYTVVASDILLDGIKVREMLQDSKPGYAPLLIAETSSYSTTSVSRVSTTSYLKNEKVATSLIGKAGSDTATQINLSFSEMSLPSEIEDSIFTHASFLESFRYKEDGVGTAVYNFTKADQEKKLVTFGAEIDNTKEYPGMQLWYYDESGYGTDDNLVKVGTITASKDEDASNFKSKYLPYVYQPFPSGTDGETKGCHEIEVNHRIVDILTGCGTYADPYVIKDGKELETIASYLQSGAPRKNWRVTITADQTAICDRRKGESSNNSLDTIYICDGSGWIIDMENPPTAAKQTLDNNTILYYLLSAYYDIQDDLVLNDFIGLGNTARGFRGVVTSTNSSSITLKGPNTSHGLIPYSYGAVVKDLTINYQKDDEGKGIEIKYSTKDPFAPSAFFGGVIGVILGGDNIIDNVSVTMEEGLLSLTGDKPHLIQAGGYVGSISGGGVIFRNMGNMDGKTGMQDNWFGNSEGWTPSTSNNFDNSDNVIDSLSLYVNPFVGRVLDGFAFSENCTVDNTDKNYKINDLGTAERNSDGALISQNYISGGTMLANGSGGSILTIQNAVGLLAFSAILNSGASAGPALGEYPGTRAYAGANKKYDQFNGYQFGNAEFGKVRCAAYSKIANPDEAEKDFCIALDDDRIAPGLQDSGGSGIQGRLNPNEAKVNLCYLAARFGDKYSMFAAVAYISDVRYVFAEEEYDMRKYGNGYQGIGCRYKANAGTNLAKEDANYDRVVPWVRYVQGNDATVKASINVREYADDDFWTMGVGAVFAYANFRNDTSLKENNGDAVSDITVSDSCLSLKYYNEDGTEVTNRNNDIKAGVGGFVGSQVGAYTIGTVRNIQIENTTIEGGYHAGGIFGSIGKVSFSAGATGAHFVYASDANSAVEFIDCGYERINVKGYFYSGGFVGEIYSKSDVTNRIQGGVGTQTSGLEGTGNFEITSTAQSDHQISVGALIGKYSSKPGGKLVIEGSLKNPFNLMTDVNLHAYGKAAGLIGWLQNTELTVKNAVVTSTTPYETTIKSDAINNGVVNYSVVGGIIGRSQDSQVLLSSCHVTNMKLGQGKETAVGGLVGDSVVSSANLNVKLETFDCSVENCQIQAGAVSKRNCYVGGLVGILGGTWVGSNILFKESKVNASVVSGATEYRGLLVGRLLESSMSYTKPFAEARVAGISMQGLDADQLSVKEIGNLDDNLLSKCYFAYADYDDSKKNQGSESGVGGNENGTAPTALLDTTAIRPYVVTSPVSSLEVVKNGTSFHLFGDGASWQPKEATEAETTEGHFLLKAETIWKEAKNESSTLFRYTRMGLDSFDFSKRFSTYLENQELSEPEKKSRTDFPVLLISGGNTDVISDYLNLLTNGGYRQACALAAGNVSAKTERYKWDDQSKKFVYSTEPASLRVGSDGAFSVTREYDNGMDQFTLLTVTFTENSAIEPTESHMYKIQIPLIVRRVLEIDFTATLSYGANLNAAAYDTAKHHVLDSFGNTISGYLTYCYNSAYGEHSVYGWQNFVNEGGNVAQRMEKTLMFKQNNVRFPSGTQLTLIDEASGVVYYKTIENDATEISMSDFRTEDGKPYQSKTIGEIMSVKAETSSNGKFIQVDENGKSVEGTDDTGKNDMPTAVVDGKYYRLAKADGTENAYQKYELTVSESRPVENYYLIITIPQSGGDPEPVNGQLETMLGGEIPHHINYKLRNENVKDEHTNTASTYLISKGYQQEIEETLDTGLPVSQMLGGSDRTIHVSVRSKISFPKEQVYQTYDSLFHSFTANLQTFIAEEGKFEAVKFPSQTNGKVYFYITDKNGNFYSDSSDWGQKSATLAGIASYDWSSDGESMELLLSSDGKTSGMIDLQGMRDAMKENGDNFFYVEAVLEAVIPAAGLEVIPESDLVAGVPENYTKLTYVSHLSTQKESLSYSSTKSAYFDTKIKYYREKSHENQFIYDADQIDQLGINLNDLRDEYLNQEGTCSRIETTAWYNLSSVRNLEQILRQSSGVQYTLSLKAKGTDLEYPEEYLQKGTDYIWLSPTEEEYRYVGNGIWKWTVPKNQYMDGDSVKIGSVFDGTAFIERIPVWIRVDNVESLNHFYSNYKLELNVEVIDAEGKPMIGPDSDYLIYTLTKIQPEFIDAVNEQPMRRTGDGSLS